MELPKKFTEASTATPNDLEIRLSCFDQECDKQILKPLAGDERVSAFAIAAKYALDTNPKFREELIGTFEARPGEPVPYTFSRMVRAFQKPLISEEGQKKFDYPKKFDIQNWSNWCVAFDWVFDHPIYSDQFSLDMWTRDLQSNIIDRGKNIKLLKLLLPEVIPTEASIFDVGCSQNRVLKKLLLNRPFTRTRVMREVEQPNNLDQPDEKEHRVDETGTSVVNSALNSEVNFGSSIGIDKEFLHDTHIKEWEEACTFLPSERLNQALRDEYDFLDGQNVPGVKFVKADFLEKSSNIFEKNGIGRHMFHFVFYSTVLYMLSENDRQTMLENGDEARHPKGLKVILDNATKDPDAPSGLRFNPNFAQDYEYTTHIDDPAGSGELLEVFQWKNGRCLELKAGRDIGRLATIPGVNTSLLESLISSD